MGSGLYSSAFSRRTFDKLANLAGTIVKAGFPAVVDATFLKRADRNQFRAVAAKLKVPFLILDFPADESACRERIRRRSAARADASEATEAVLDHQLRTSEPLDDDERPLVISFGETDPAAAATASGRN